MVWLSDRDRLRFDMRSGFGDESGYHVILGVKGVFWRGKEGWNKAGL